MCFSFGILATVLASVIRVASQDQQVATATMGIGLSEMRAQQMLRTIETELANARGEVPIASLTEDLSLAQSALIEVDSTLGFPPIGTLLFQRGTELEERVDYTGLTADQTSFTGLTRGVQCTAAAAHEAGTGDTVMWAGLAESIELQTDPPASAFDGQAAISAGTLFFRGDGSGFSYRVPIDPTGAIPPNYLSAGELQWGHEIDGNPSTADWACLYFSPVRTIKEADVDVDMNDDGDRLDTFDLGQIRRRIWNTDNPAIAPADLGLGPTNILQERCDWGNDLDSDGFDDPIFLWDADSRQLHVQLLIMGYSATDRPITRRVNSVVYLRNQPEN
jgi:hypothetical protein